jgi:double-stranded uracil-DNA glycosylase
VHHPFPALHPPLPPDGLTSPSRRGAPWNWEVPDVAPEALPLLFHRAHRNIEVGSGLALSVGSRVDADLLIDLVDGAGWSLLDGPVARAGRRSLRVERRHTLADSVGPNMRLLVCGINPSPYSADIGVGYGRPGNRFWPAALASGIVSHDRDPAAALAAGLGMTDFAKRATAKAAEVTRPEHVEGFARVTRLVAWLRPGAVCFVGLSGWRTVVDRHAVAGIQPGALSGRPVYLMPSTSGLNARTPPAALSGHLEAAWALGR